MTTNGNLSNAHIFAQADYLSQRGDALLHYFDKCCGIDHQDMAVIFREAGLGFTSHRLNGEDGGYRAQRDFEATGHTLALRDRITDRSERLSLIEDAVNSYGGNKVAANFDQVVNYIRNERTSRITLEKDPAAYRESFDAMRQDLIDILKVKGLPTTLAPRDIIRFFGMEEATFHANFAKMAEELREERGIDSKAIPMIDEDGCTAGIAYAFDLDI